MTLQESKQWLLNRVNKNTISPYKCTLIRPVDKEAHPQAPVCKLYTHWNCLMFLLRDMSFAYWMWDEEDPRLLAGESELPRDAISDVLWSAEIWYLNSAPYSVGDWYYENGML